MTTIENSFIGSPEIKTMTMNAQLDQGLYRHLEFRQPDTSMYWYDIITVPGELIFTGDIGAYVFRREQDMLRFFRESTWEGNPDLAYWSEKVTQPGRNDITREHSEQVFKNTMEEQLDCLGDDPEAAQQIRTAWKEHLKEYAIDREQGAFAALQEFNFEGFQFEELWEFDFRDFTPSFQWACHAILHAANTHTNQHQDTQ